MAKARFDFGASAATEMVRQGFTPEFPAEVRDEILLRPDPDPSVPDLRDLAWSSIDNSSSKDLDQIEWAERVDGGIRLQVAIADVDAVVRMGTATDGYAAKEATSVYVPGQVFPMLPRSLSEDLTSLLPNQDRLAVVIEIIVAPDGTASATRVQRAWVRNRCQLTYGRTGAWLEGRGAVPEEMAASVELREQVRLQDEVAGWLRGQRSRMGGLPFDRREASAVIVDGRIERIETRQKNRASDLIEDLMIAANEAMARTLSESGMPGIRRVVKSPERWPRIVQLAAAHGTTLPGEPSSLALAEFLNEQREKDPEGYPDLSLSAMKLMGPGEYVVVAPKQENAGHFGLATNDYTHSTAPNRRFADLVTQRLIKAVLGKRQCPYSEEELAAIARNCTLKEDAARKVERTMQKRAAAYALRSRVGQTFRTVVTGVTSKGVFVRVTDPPVDGRVMRGDKGLDVGDRVKLTLLGTDPENGFIDFGR